jgi:hypothetical protein
MKNEPVTVICTYRVKASDQDDFVLLLREHWPTLRAAGLVTETPVQHFLGDDGGLGPRFVEIFEWTDEEAPGIAHSTPEVMRCWEGMGKHVEERGPDKPAMEFPHFAPFQA